MHHNYGLHTLLYGARFLLSTQAHSTGIIGDFTHPWGASDSPCIDAMLGTSPVDSHGCCATLKQECQHDITLTVNVDRRVTKRAMTTPDEHYCPL